MFVFEKKYIKGQRGRTKITTEVRKICLCKRRIGFWKEHLNYNFKVLFWRQIFFAWHFIDWYFWYFLKFHLYTRNLKYWTLNTIFRQHNIRLVFCTCQHNYKGMLCTEKLVLNLSFQDFWCTNIIIIWFASKKT